MLKPYRQAGSTTCRQCMCAVARRLTRPDSRPKGIGIMLMIRVFLFAVSLSARISDLASALTRSTATGAWMLLGAAPLCIALPGLVPMLGGSAHAGVTLEERKLPMKFSWVACQPNCRGWVSAVGIVTSDSPKDFEDFAREHKLDGATVVLDSSGGSVNDSIALGRHFRSPRHADYRRRQRAKSHRAGRPRPRDGRGLLRVYVRVPAVVGQDPLRA